MASNSFDDPSIPVLPRLKDDKAGERIDPTLRYKDVNPNGFMSG